MGAFMAFLLILIILISMYLFLMFVLVKYLSMTVDYLAIAFFTVYFLHSKVSVQISTGYAVYFWDAVMVVVFCLIYHTLMKFIFDKLPKISKVVNYLMVCFGLYLAMPFAIQTALDFGNGIDNSIRVGYTLPLLKSELGNDIIFVIMLLVLSFPVYRMRMEKLGLDDKYNDLEYVRMKIKQDKINHFMGLGYTLTEAEDIIKRQEEDMRRRYSTENLVTINTAEEDSN